MRWDLIASPQLQNWFMNRHEHQMIAEFHRMSPFWTSGKSTRNYAASFLDAIDQFGVAPPEVATNDEYNQWQLDVGGRRHAQARGDLGRVDLWVLDEGIISYTLLGLEFFNRIQEQNLVENVQENLGGHNGPKLNPDERVLEEARCFELLEAALDLQNENYVRYYNYYCQLREYLPANYLPDINQVERYDEDYQLADFFHLMQWLNIEIGGYNPFLALIQALEHNGEYFDELSLESEFFDETYGFNLQELNYNGGAWAGEMRSKSTPTLMWIHAMERMASGGVAPPIINIEEGIEREIVDNLPVLGVGQDFNQVTTPLLPEGVEINAPPIENQAGGNPNNGEPRPGDIYFVIRFVRDEENVPRLFPLAKVGAAYLDENNPHIEPSRLREVGARRETNFPLFDSEGRMIEHLTVARLVCSDIRRLEGTTGLRGHLNSRGFNWERMIVTRQRENILLFGELGQDMNHIGNEQRNVRLHEALQAMCNHPREGHWGNVESFEIVRPELLVEFGIEWDDIGDLVPWL